MKFLLDMPVSQRTGVWLRAQGHDVVHARDIGLARAADEQLLQHALKEGRIVLTMDLDFPHLLSQMPSAEGPGIILIRLRFPDPITIQQRLETLFRTVTELDFARTILVLEESRIRFHRLPIS